MKKIKSLLHHLLESNLFLKIFSLVLAFFVWLVIVFATDNEYKRTIENVPITYTATATLSKQELSVISIEPQTVDVEVVGTRYVVRGLGPADLSMSLQLGSIVNAGTQSVLVQSDTESSDFTIKAITPAQAQVRVDRMDTKTVEVQAAVTGVNVADGFMKDDEIISPERITITGPVGDINKVAHAIVAIDVGKTLSATESVTGDIILRDADGKDVVSDHITMDYDAAQVTIPVLKKKEVPVAVEFNNQPPHFPLEDLHYSFSNDTIEIAGPATLIDSYDSITLGYIDFKRMGVGYREVFDVVLPTNFINVSGVQSVSVSFDTDAYEIRMFDIPEVEVVNEPSNYEVTIAPGSLPLRDVQIVGPRDVLSAMTAEDLVAQVDLSGQERELATGQIRVAVKVFAPTKGTVWAYGSYDAIVDINER